MKKISIIIPAYNEAANLEGLADALCPLIHNELTPGQYSWEVIIVNDGSTDHTLRILRQLHSAESSFNFIDLSRNFGKEAAMMAGLDYARGDAVVIMDADLQHPVNVIPQMIQEWEQGYDDVYGLKTYRGKESWMRKKLSGMYYRMLGKGANVEVLPNVGDFRLFDRRCVDALRSLRESQRYSKGLFSWIGFRKKSVEFECDERQAGPSRFSYKALFSLALDGITGFTTAPLRIASCVGILTAAAALIYLVYVLCKALIYGDPVAGYPTLMCVILFLGGSQLIALGIIGEYIARIFNEAKRRPPYLVRESSVEELRS